MRVIKAHNVMACQRGLALNANQLSRTYMVTVLWRVRAGVVTDRNALHLFISPIKELSHQHAATLMWISLLAVFAQLFEKRFPNL